MLIDSIRGHADQARGVEGIVDRRIDRIMGLGDVSEALRMRAVAVRDEFDDIGVAAAALADPAGEVTRLQGTEACPLIDEEARMATVFGDCNAQ